jgi:AAA domain
MIDKRQFVAVAQKLVRGVLREAIGYSVEFDIPYYQGTVGFMLEAPMLWIRHSRFPIILIAYDRRRSDTLDTIVTQLQVARAAEFFALLIVVPTEDETGREAEEVRRLVRDTVYRYDFVVLDRESLASIVAHNSSRRLVEIILEQGMELSNLSPYVVRGPVPEKMFFGREKEIRTVSQGLLTGDYAIVGGRRIGKSSVLQRVNRLLSNDPRYQPYYIDCEAKFNHHDFIQTFRDDLGEALDTTNVSVIRQLLTELRLEAPGRQLVLLLDEVDELLAFDAQSQPFGRLFKTFRSLSQEGVCRFVFSGSRTLYRHLHNPQSPFFNFCEDMVLKPLEQRSIVEIVTKPMHQLGIELPEEEQLIDRIIHLSSSHPNIAQWLCDRLIKSSTVRRITLDNLDKISDDPEFCRHYVETAWCDATSFEKLISLLIDAPSFDIDELCKKLAQHGLADRNLIRESLEMLQLCSLLDRRGQQYYFALALFPEIVRQVEDVASQIRFLMTQVDV